MHALQRRAHLDHVQHDGGAECGNHLGRPQHVEHHGAAPWSKLHQPHVFRRSHGAPGRGRPEPKQLAEHLADLRRGNEIPSAADRRAAHIVAVLGVGEAERHVLGDRQGPDALNAPSDLRLERRRVRRPHGCSAALRRAVTSIRTKPARMSGSDSSIPIVTPPQRKPSCTSGSRKNSPIVRAIP